MARVRNWIFTIFDDFDINEWQKNDDVGFCVWQTEQCPDTEKIHKQGYIEMKKVCRLSAMKKMHATAHWEPRQGKQGQAIAYCEKEESRIDGPWRFGEPKEQGKRTDIEAVVSAVKEGMADVDLQDEFPNKYVKYFKAIDRVRVNLFTTRNAKTEVRWYWGATGTGKSREAHEEFPDAYWKDMSDGKWWDGYMQQEAVVFDDMRKDTFKFHELLRLFDRYPHKVQYKGGSCEFNSRIIIVTSCYPPERLYDTREDLKQLIRRIETIRKFGEEEEVDKFGTKVFVTEVAGNTKPQLPLMVCPSMEVLNRLKN